METIVLKLTKTQIQTLIEHYQSKKITTKAPYVTFAAKSNQTTITVYTSQKVMFQGQQANLEAQKWSTTLPEKKATKKTQPALTQLPENLAQLPFIGSDEVGNGSYFGPLVVCAAFAGPEHFAALKALGVKDSKLLTDAQILTMAPKIKKLLPYKELIVMPEKYNEIQPQYNAVRMKVALHNQAVCLLEPLVSKADGILIDQFTPEKNYRKYLAMETTSPTLPLYFVTKGEQYHLAVASASIICRATFLTTLSTLSKEAGITLPSGAGAKSDDVAAQLISRFGVDVLTRYAKLHFANTKKAIQKATH